MSLFKRLFNAINSGSVSDNEWEEIRVSLIESDLGVKLTDELISMAKTTKPEDAKEAIMAEVKNGLAKMIEPLNSHPDEQIQFWLLV